MTRNEKNKTEEEIQLLATYERILAKQKQLKKLM